MILIATQPAPLENTTLDFTEVQPENSSSFFGGCSARNPRAAAEVAVAVVPDRNRRKAALILSMKPPAQAGWVYRSSRSRDPELLTLKAGP